MSGILNKLKVERSEGMRRIDADQEALKDTLEAESASSDTKYVEANEIGHGQGQQLDRAPNTAGGPSFGRTSTIPQHKSEALNKVDPRIGYDSDDVRKEDLEGYEKKYGKPGDIADGHLRGRDMAGIGADSSALEQPKV